MSASNPIDPATPQQPYVPPQPQEYQGFFASEQPPLQPGSGPQPQYQYPPPQQQQSQPQFGQQAPQFGQPPLQNQGWAPHPEPGQQQGWQQQPKRGRPAGPRRKQSKARIGCLSIIGVIVLIIIIAVAVNSGKGSNSPASSSTTQPAAAANNPAPSSPAPTTQAPAATQDTMSQQQAIDAAQGYLSDGQGFSYQGLIDQLDSSYGNGFSVADATFAVNHVQVNWNHQAAIAAKGYMQTEPGWSCSGLVQQLDSPDGGQFTQAQAEYGAQSVGLGNC